MLIRVVASLCVRAFVVVFVFSYRSCCVRSCLRFIRVSVCLCVGSCLCVCARSCLRLWMRLCLRLFGILCVCVRLFAHVFVYTLTRVQVSRFVRVFVH